MLAKAILIPTAKQTSNSSDGKLGPLLVDLSGGKEYTALVGKRYGIVFRDDHSRCMWVYLLLGKSDAASAIEKFLCDTRSDGEVAIIRTDGGNEFQGPFQELRLKPRIQR